MGAKVAFAPIPLQQRGYCSHSKLMNFTTFGKGAYGASCYIAREISLSMQPLYTSEPVILMIPFLLTHGCGYTLTAISNG